MHTLIVKEQIVILLRRLVLLHYPHISFYSLSHMLPLCLFWKLFRTPYCVFWLIPKDSIISSGYSQIAWSVFLCSVIYLLSSCIDILCLSINNDSNNIIHIFCLFLVYFICFFFAPFILPSNAIYFDCLLSKQRKLSF